MRAFAMPQPDHEHPLAICLLFKDSAAYLDEWLRFHHLQGCSLFYLYNNESTDDYRRVLEPWIQAGLVLLSDYPGLAIQAPAYDDCIARARGKVRWLAFLDDDEFLYSPTGRPLIEVLDDYRDHAGVAACWVLFGSDGAQRQTAEWVTSRFTRSSGHADAHVKCIVRPERTGQCLAVGHQFAPLDGYQFVNEQGDAVTTPFSEKPSARLLRINHYLVKSWEEWTFRRARPQANTGVPTPLPEASWREWDKGWCAVEDKGLLKFHPAMRALRIGGESLLRRLIRGVMRPFAIRNSGSA